MMLRTALIVALLGSVACSGSERAGGGGPDAGHLPATGGNGVSADAVAQAACDWMVRCGQPATNCTPKAPYLRRPLFSSAIIQEEVDCYRTLVACDSDPCDHGILVRETDSATGQRKTALDACAEDFSRCSFEQLECIGLAAMTDAALVPFQQCFDETACGDIADCLTTLGFPVQSAN